MKTETRFFRVSFKEMGCIFFMSFFFLNGLTYLIFTLFLKISFGELFESVWVILVFVPLAQGVIQPLVNRRGVLIVKSSIEDEVLINKIKKVLHKLGYCEVQRRNGAILFDYEKRWKRVLFTLLSEQVKIGRDDEFAVYAKRFILTQLETKLKVVYKTST